jgi:hypothetical protein
MNINKHRVNDKKKYASPDNLYIDVKVSNIGDKRGVLAEFNQTKTEPLLDNPSDYYLSLIRWKVPAFPFPLLIFPIQDNQPDPNLSQYSITFETATNTYQYFLYFTNRNSTASPTTAVPRQKQSFYYFIYEYQHLVDIINHGFQMCFENVTGKPAGAVAPYMIFDPQTKLFSIIAQEANYGVNISPSPIPPANPTTPPTYDAPIKIFFNFKLFELFNGLPIKTFPEPVVDEKDAQILVTNTGNNVFDTDASGNILQIQQNLISLAYWTPVKQVLFTTTLMPIKSEYTSTSGNSYKKILTDFEPIADSDSDIRETIQYYPQGEYRLIDLIGTNPLFNIDLKVTWQDVKGDEYDAFISPFQQFTAKLLFIKRSLKKNFNKIYE